MILYIHIHLTKPSKFIFQILGSMRPPPSEDNTVPLAPDGGHYVNARSTYPYVYIYIYICMYIYIYIHIHLTTPSKFFFKILGSMGPPPWEDNTVPLAPDGGHYVNACSSIYIC